MSSESNRGAVIDVTPGGEVGPPSQLVTVGHIVYACYAVGYFVMFTWLIGVIVAYVKRDDARGTWMESHFGWLIRTFWWSIVWTIVGTILFLTLVLIPVAYIVWGLAWVWGLYRVIKGWMRLNEGRPVG